MAGLTQEEQRKQWRKRQARRRAKLEALVSELLPLDQCFRCRCYPEYLEFAHIKPTGLSGRARGRTETLKDIIKNPDSYKRLCYDCHRAFDRGEVGLELEPAPF